MELASEKRQLLTQQQSEREHTLAALDQLNTDYHRELEYYRRQARQKAFTHEITRARRHSEEKSFWEYINTVVEHIHLFTWKKTVNAACRAKYKRKRLILEEELLDQQAEHRKERITLRFRSPSELDEPRPNVRVEPPRFTSS